MGIEQRQFSYIENHVLASNYLNRNVIVDCYLPYNINVTEGLSLLLINDGQDLIKMNFAQILENQYQHQSICPIFCVGIHCGIDRKNEYGTADILDYQGLGTKSNAYQKFILEELLPYIRMTYKVKSFKDKSFSGFSLGGLSALDLVWKNSQEFCKVGVFSGSLWWRDKSANEKDFDENVDRIMHRKIRNGKFGSWLRFFFEVGTLDETADRNNNGIIDAIDDTVSLIQELEKKGYNIATQIKYLELQDGKHDVATWERAFPTFLQWGWGNQNQLAI